jgi:hypothetical protein
MKFALALVAGVLPVLLAQTARLNSSFPGSATIYVSARDGSDNWTGRVASPTKTDGPLATFEKARQVVQNLNETGLRAVRVQFRSGTYFFPRTEYLTSADSGTPSTEIIYENFPGETPVFSGGAPIKNWTAIGGRKWSTTLTGTIFGKAKS